MTTAQENQHLKLRDRKGVMPFALALLSILLCFVTPLGILAPVPLVAIGLKGKEWHAASYGLGSLVFLFLLSSQNILSPLVVGFYPLAMGVALFILEGLRRKTAPIRLLTTGILCLIGIFIGALAIVQLSGVSLDEVLTTRLDEELSVLASTQKEILSKGGPEARKIEDLLGSRETLLKEIKEWWPIGLFISTVLAFWIPLFVVLKNIKEWGKEKSYPYGLGDLVRFKVPDFIIWPFMLCLGLWVGGHYLPEIKEFSGVGQKGTFVLGTFYFLQGLGIQWDLLVSMKLPSFLRTLLMTFSVLAAWQFVTVMGVFDLWFDFRKKLIKNKKD